MSNSNFPKNQDSGKDQEIPNQNEEKISGININKQDIENKNIEINMLNELEFKEKKDIIVLEDSENHNIQLKKNEEMEIEVENKENNELMINEEEKHNMEIEKPGDDQFMEMYCYPEINDLIENEIVYPLELQEPPNVKNNDPFKNNQRNKVHSALPEELNKIYYRKKNGAKPIQDIDKNEPHMKITVMKSNAEAWNNSIEYFVCPLGVAKSEKNTVTEDVIIGRQQATIEEIRPNDIILPSTDRAISRIHCKIIYKDGFNIPRRMPDYFIAFLMMNDLRLGALSPGYGLPKYLYRNILSFIRPSRKFFIVDIGSVYGTYIRIKPINPHLIEKGQVYLIGAETLFYITEKMSKAPKNALLANSDPNFLENENEEFFKYLAFERKNGVTIHGLNEIDLGILDSYVKKISDENAFSINETQQYGKSINRPFLRIEFQPNVNLVNLPLNHIFVGDNDNNKQLIDFKIGRAQDCQIIINHNTVSRRQCRIRYKPEKDEWILMDGDLNKESANGTWISLTDYRLKKERQESEPKEIENETEIKISDSILKIEIKNNEEKKKHPIGFTS